MAATGDFRATFEDQIKPSDIIMLKSWISVPLPNFYNPIIDLESWRAMKTIKQLRIDTNTPVPVQKESEYAKGKQERATERGPVRLKVGKKLMKALPFKTKAKVREELNPNSGAATKVKVIRSAEEKAVSAMMQRLNVVKKDKLKVREAANKKRLVKKEKQAEYVQKLRDEHTKENKKRKYALDGDKELKKKKRMGI